MPQSSHWSTWSGRLKRITTLARAHSAFRSGRCTCFGQWIFIDLGREPINLLGEGLPESAMHR
jgi:hypothetical protein